MSSVRRLLPRRDRACLVVVDVQEKLVPFLAEKDAFLAHLEYLIGTARGVGIPILVTEQYPNGLGSTIPEVRSWVGEGRAVEKMTFSSCREPGFARALDLSGRDEVILCGIEAHVCVAQTALDLVDLGKAVFLAADAVASRHVHDRDSGVELVRSAGAIVTTAETIGFALFERAGTDEFKAMQKLVIAKDRALERTRGT